jgi:hypothetical protein
VFFLRDLGDHQDHVGYDVDVCPPVSVFLLDTPWIHWVPRTVMGEYVFLK